MRNSTYSMSVALVVSLASLTAFAEGPTLTPDQRLGPSEPFHFKPEEKTSEGSVTIGGKSIEYQAVLGTLVVHPKGWDDVPKSEKDIGPTAEAAMSFVAYFKHAASAEARPLTFLYNGGPGAASLWLHMGAFGPKRVITADNTHSPPAPYRLINNGESLLDASDLVFVDAPGTGFGRLAGKDKEKAFWGIDPDAHAFAEFITQFLSKYGRWNSPKFLFGESYGTTRSVVLINLLETDRTVDFNGVILLSQNLSFDNSPWDPQSNPGIDLPYELALPTYAATAWYHHKLPESPKDLKTLIDEVEQFATTDYAQALAAGSALAADERRDIAERLHRYTGLPLAYILKADLRVNAGEFEKTLQGDDDLTTGRTDARFSGPDLDSLSPEADYDAADAALSSAYLSTYEEYVHRQLKYSSAYAYIPFIPIWDKWDFRHRPPGARHALSLVQSVNVLPDLATAMKINPKLRVMTNAGYFDLATPFFQGVWEMRHLAIPANLQSNLELRSYESGHMVYAHEAALKQLHDAVANFIRKASQQPAD